MAGDEVNVGLDAHVEEFVDHGIIVVLRVVEEVLRLEPLLDDTDAIHTPGNKVVGWLR